MATSTYTWSGNVTGYKNIRFSFSPSSYTGFEIVSGEAGGTIPGTKTLSVCGSTADGELDWPSRFNMLPILGAGPPLGTTQYDQFAFPVKATKSSYSGSRTVVTNLDNGSWIREVFTFALVRTCTMGGTHC
jgi:hypothetical protein